ncbi:uncharacterized protein LOC107045863 [Diachasma alloeum]|uniref:uncharacterized protein LOC107045863 n=1 Tax=Diachasma alloeum TaxID=454923 RepID=UPI0007384784|nr:uncharacterized protein LOC107045863 [Diachasma alloeum]
MVFKKFCVIALACAYFVHSAPKHTFLHLPSNQDDLFNKIGKAAYEILDEKEKVFRDNMDSMIETGKTLYNASIQSWNTKMVLVKLPFRFVLKLFGKHTKQPEEPNNENPVKSSNDVPAIQPDKPVDEAPAEQPDKPCGGGSGKAAGETAKEVPLKNNA